MPDAYDVLSLDVFDTALARGCGPPEALFLWLGRRLAQAGVLTCTPEIFARARLQADVNVWARAGGLDARVSVTDFATETVRLLGLPSDHVDALVAAELALEADVLSPVPSAVRLLEETAATGRRVVFTSDTYCSGEFLEEQLRRAGLWTAASRVFASSDLGIAKASGRLFDHLVKAAGVPAQRILHAGDHPHSDDAMPRHLGLQVLPQPDGRLNRYEALLAEYMWATSGTSAALAGASRRTRLEQSKAADDRSGVIVDVAAGVAAPVLVGYALWLLRRAQDLGLRRLHFLARDGQLLSQIVTILARRLDLAVEVNYLYVSRRSTNLAATFEADEEDLGWVFRDLPHLSPALLLSRFDISWDEAQEYVVPLGIQDSTGRITPDVGRGLADLLGRGALRPLLLERARQRRELVTAYLEQEGVLEGACGIVDLGGVGSQVRALHRLVTEAGGAPPRLFLMGMDDPAAAGLPVPSTTPSWLSDTECYLFDDRRGLGMRRPRGLVTILQMFLAADHGTVIGYRRDGDSVRPVLAHQEDEAVVAWGLRDLQSTVARVAEHVILDADVVDPWADLRDAACAVIRTLWSTPTRAEAVTWGTFPFEGAQATGSTAEPLAHRYTVPFVVRGMRERSFPNLGWQHWFEGSLALSNPLLRRTLSAADAAYRRLDGSIDPRTAGLARAVRRRLGR